TQALGQLALRTNMKNGLVANLLVSHEHWVRSNETDLAVVRLLPTEGVDWRWIPIDQFATPEYIKARNIGIGDEVFFSGLFSEFPGEKHIQPIVRFGNISFMADPNE